MQAWLQITPKDSERTNAKIYEGVELPDVPFQCGHLPKFLTEIGTAMHGFDGLVPLTFAEIKAWADLMNINLSIFEASALHKMSLSFVSTFNKKDSECPVKTEETQSAVNIKNASTWATFGKRG